MFFRGQIITLLSFALFGAAAPTHAAPIAFKSEAVTLPDGASQMFQGPGAEAINNNCLACHSADMVLNQPALTADAWKAEVNKMINVYKAPVAPADIPAILAWHTQAKGKN
jgi:hypothetical protein